MDFLSHLSPHIWWMAAIFSSLFNAVYYTANQYFKLPGITLVFWRGFIPFLVLTPAIFFIEWPTNPLFYLVAIIAGSICVYADSRNIQGSSIYGGGQTMRLKPFTLWLLFALWFIFDASHRQALLSDVPRFIGIIMTMGIAVLAASQLSKCTINKSAFFYFLPALFASVAINFLVKLGMDLSPLLGGIIIFAWIDGVIITTSSTLLHITRKDLSIKSLFQKQMCIAGLIIGCAIFMQIIGKNVAMTYAVNPAYVVAIVFTSAFWTALFYKSVGHKEKGDVRNGLIFVISAIILVLLTSSG